MAHRCGGFAGGTRAGARLLEGCAAARRVLPGGPGHLLPAGLHLRQPRAALRSGPAVGAGDGRRAALPCPVGAHAALPGRRAIPVPPPPLVGAQPFADLPLRAGGGGDVRLRAPSLSVAPGRARQRGDLRGERLHDRPPRASEPDRRRRLAAPAPAGGRRRLGRQSHGRRVGNGDGPGDDAPRRPPGSLSDGRAGGGPDGPAAPRPRRLAEAAPAGGAASTVDAIRRLRARSGAGRGTDAPDARSGAPLLGAPECLAGLPGHLEPAPRAVPRPIPAGRLRSKRSGHLLGDGALLGRVHLRRSSGAGAGRGGACQPASDGPFLRRPGSPIGLAGDGNERAGILPAAPDPRLRDHAAAVPLHVPVRPLGGSAVVHGSALAVTDSAPSGPGPRAVGAGAHCRHGWPPGTLGARVGPESTPPTGWGGFTSARCEVTPGA